jgi:hypothetical protein
MYGSRIWLYRLTAKRKWWLFHRLGPGKPLKGGAAFNLDRVRSNKERFHTDVVEIKKNIEWPVIISRYQKITKIEEMMEALKPWEKREVTNAKGGV